MPIHVIPAQDGTTNIGGTYIDFLASAEHYPSLWQVTVKQTNKHLTRSTKATNEHPLQDPAEEVRYAPMAAELAAVKEVSCIALQSVKTPNLATLAIQSPVHQFTISPKHPFHH